MRTHVGTAAAALALAGQGTAQSNYTVKCYDGLAVFVNRASTEPLGFGVQASIESQILDKIPNSGAWYNPYPATLTNYPSSQMLGVSNLTAVIKAYVDKCPCHKYALLGFSQGAHVISDTLIGPSYPAFAGFGVNSGIGHPYTDALSAAALFADPAQIANLTGLDAGNATQSGLFQRNNTANWAAQDLVGRVRAYCQADDFYCASGTSNASHAIHRMEVNTYGAQGLAFILQKWNDGPQNVCTTNSTSSSNATSTASTASTVSTTVSSSGVATSTPSGTVRPTSGGMKTGLSGFVLLAALVAAL